MESPQELCLLGMQLPVTTSNDACGISSRCHLPVLALAQAVGIQWKPGEGVSYGKSLGQGWGRGSPWQSRVRGPRMQRGARAGAWHCPHSTANMPDLSWEARQLSRGGFKLLANQGQFGGLSKSFDIIMGVLGQEMICCHRTVQFPTCQAGWR